MPLPHVPLPSPPLSPTHPRVAGYELGSRADDPTTRLEENLLDLVTRAEPRKYTCYRRRRGFPLANDLFTRRAPSYRLNRANGTYLRSHCIARVKNPRIFLRRLEGPAPPSLRDGEVRSVRRHVHVFRCFCCRLLAGSEGMRRQQEAPRVVNRRVEAAKRGIAEGDQDDARDDVDGDDGADSNDEGGQEDGVELSDTRAEKFAYLLSYLIVSRPSSSSSTNYRSNLLELTAISRSVLINFL